jgi:hypothetical protein
MIKKLKKWWLGFKKKHIVTEIYFEDEQKKV